MPELATYERLSHGVSVTEELLIDSLFGERRVAEALLGYLENDPAGFAIFFHNFSTFLGKPGIYLEDLYVRPEFRGAGAGGSNGQSWTGTSRPSASTKASAPPR